MVINFFGWVARRRVPLLVMALVTAVALQVLLRYTQNSYDFRLRGAAGVLPALAFVLCSAFAARFFHPAKLVARPEVPALDVPANPGVVLISAMGYTFFAVFILGGLARDIAAYEELWWLPAILAVLLTGQLAAFWRSALGGFGARLTPDGIKFRESFGSLFIPWEALVTAYPRDALQVTLHLAHPELVRGRGFRYSRPTLVPAAGVDAELLARAIHEYANSAQLRPGIGTTAELDRFLAILSIGNPANQA